MKGDLRMSGEDTRKEEGYKIIDDVSKGKMIVEELSEKLGRGLKQSATNRYQQ